MLSLPKTVLAIVAVLVALNLFAFSAEGEGLGQGSVCGGSVDEVGLVERIIKWWPSLIPPPSSRGAWGQKDGFTYIVRKQDVSEGRFVPLQISTSAGYTSPVFGDRDSSIYSLREEELFVFQVSDLIRQPISKGGVGGLEPRKVGLVKGAVLLLGFADTESRELLFLQELDGRQKIAAYCLETGKSIELSGDSESSTAWRNVLELASRDWRVYREESLFSVAYSRPGERVERSCLRLMQQKRSSELCRSRMGEESFQGSFSEGGELIVFVGRGIAMSTD